MHKSFYIIAMLSLVTCAWSQSGFAQVGPSGGVNVNVVNTPLPVQGTVTGTVTGSVEISNPATNPVLVRDVNALAKEPFQAATPFVSFTGGGKTTVVVTVPANKR